MQPFDVNGTALIDYFDGPNLFLGRTFNNFGQLTIEEAGTIENPGGNGVINNNTTTFYVEAADLPTTLATAFNNMSGATVTINGGSLILNGGGNGVGSTFALGSEGALTFGCSYGLSSTTTISGSGLVGFTNGNNTINGSFSASQLVVAGTANTVVTLNQSLTLANLLLSGGTLTGSGNITVSNSFDWYGGTLSSTGTITGGAGATDNRATLTIQSSASMFLFGGGELAASNRIIINNGESCWLQGVTLNFAGGVTFSNGSPPPENGTAQGGSGAILTVLDGATLRSVVPSTSSNNANFVNVFNNYGTLVCGSVGTLGEVSIVGMAFNNYRGQVSLKTGGLEIQPGGPPDAQGISTGTWYLADSTTLTFQGSGQDYQLNSGTSFQYQQTRQGPPIWGTIVVQGVNLRVQTDVQMASLNLNSGIINGSGCLSISSQMLWFGGAMYNVAAGFGVGGSTVIMSNAVLYLMGNGQQLNRILNLEGKVGWVGTGEISDIYNGKTFLNYFLQGVAYPSDGSLPALTVFNSNNLYSAPNINQLTSAVIDILSDKSKKTTVMINGSPWNYQNLPAQFTMLPAVVRVSLSVAFTQRMQAAGVQGPDIYLVVALKKAGYDATAINRLIYGQRNNPNQPKVVSPGMLGWIDMALGVGAGIASGAFGRLQGIADLAVQLATSPIATIKVIVEGISTTVGQLSNGQIKEAFSAQFPEIAELVTNWSSLSDYDRGFLIGKVIGQLATDAAIGAAARGLAGTAQVQKLFKSAADKATKTAQAAANVTRRFVPNLARTAARTVARGALRTAQAANNVRQFPARVVGAARDALLKGLESAAARVLPARLAAPVAAWAYCLRTGQGCFAAGTPLFYTLWDSKPIEQFKPNELILSRSEDDPDGPAELKRVLEVYVRFAGLMELQVGGKTIKTTLEHPFYVRDKGWVKAFELERGDWLVGHEREWVMVEKTEDTGEFATVYNMLVEDYHTYFVGSRDWGISVWAHNYPPNNEHGLPVNRPGVHTHNEGIPSGPGGGSSSSQPRYRRNLEERRQALLRDAADPASGLTEGQRVFIREHDGRRVPPGMEVSHEEPLYTRPRENRPEIDTSDNMRTQPREEHRRRHRVGGDQYDEFGPPSDYPWNKRE